MMGISGFIYLYPNVILMACAALSIMVSNIVTRAAVFWRGTVDYFTGTYLVDPERMRVKVDLGGI